MTPEEKNAVMQFMGTTYGEAHKNDGMMVSPSTNLKPSAELAKRVFEETARMPTVNRSNQPLPQPPANLGEFPPEEQAPTQVVAPVSPEQAAQEIAAQRIIRTEQPPAPVAEEVDPNQVEFDFSEPAKIDQLIDLIKDQNLILKDIRLKLSDGKNAKSKK